MSRFTRVLLPDPEGPLITTGRGMVATCLSKNLVCREIASEMFDVTAVKE